MLIKRSSRLDRSLAESKFFTLKPVDHLIDPKDTNIVAII